MGQGLGWLLAFGDLGLPICLWTLQPFINRYITTAATTHWSSRNADMRKVMGRGYFRHVWQLTSKHYLKPQQPISFWKRSIFLLWELILHCSKPFVGKEEFKGSTGSQKGTERDWMHDLVPCISGKWVFFVSVDGLCRKPPGPNRSTCELQNPHKHHSALSCLHLQALSHNHKQSRHHSASSMGTSWPTPTLCSHLPAPAEPTSTHLDHLHGAFSKQNLLPTLPGWQEVINESDLMPFLAMVWTCLKCREMEQLLEGTYPNSISEGFLQFFFPFHQAGRAQYFLTLLASAAVLNRFLT